MDNVFVIVEGVLNTFHAVASNLDKAQRFVLGTFPTAEQVDDLTWRLPNGTFIYILEKSVL